MVVPVARVAEVPALVSCGWVVGRSGGASAARRASGPRRRRPCRWPPSHRWETGCRRHRTAVAWRRPALRPAAFRRRVPRSRVLACAKVFCASDPPSGASCPESCSAQEYPERTKKVHQGDRLNAELVAEGLRRTAAMGFTLVAEPVPLARPVALLEDVRRLVSRARRGLGGARQRRCACRQRTREGQRRRDGEQGGSSPPCPPRLARLYGFLHDPGLDIVEPVRFHGADRSAVRADPHHRMTKR